MKKTGSGKPNLENSRIRMAKSLASGDDTLRPRVSADEARLLQAAREHGAEAVLRAMQGLAPEPEYDPLMLIEGMPGSECDERPVWHLPAAPEGLAYALFDLHAPFHDAAFISYVVKQAARRGVKKFIIGGDGADCYAISRFERRPDRRRFKAEVDVVVMVLEAIRRCLGDDVEIDYLTGNHELRYQRKIEESLGELHGLIPDLAQQFRLSDMGIKMLPNQDGVLLGGLHIEHGDHIPAGGQINPARNSGLRLMGSSMSGHIHRTSTFEPRSFADGSQTFSVYKVGASCGHQSYAPRNNWNLGFARIWYTPDSFRVENVRMRNGREEIVL